MSQQSPPAVSQLHHLAFDPEYISAALEYMAINSSNGINDGSRDQVDEDKEKKNNEPSYPRRRLSSKDINESSRGMRTSSVDKIIPPIQEGEDIRAMFKLSGVRQTPAQEPEVNGDWRAVYNVISENVNEITNNIILPAVDYGSKNIIVPAIDYGQSLVETKERDGLSTPDNNTTESGRRDLVDPKTMEAINEGVNATAEAIMELWTPIQETVNTYAEAAFNPATYNQSKPKLVDIDDFRDKINAITIDNINKKTEALNVTMSSNSQDASETSPVYRNLTVEKIFDSNSRVYSVLLNINHSLQRNHSDLLTDLDERWNMKIDEEKTISDSDKKASRFEAHSEYVADMDKISTSALEEAYNKLIEVENILFNLKTTLQNTNTSFD